MRGHEQTLRSLLPQELLNASYPSLKICRSGSCLQNGVFKRKAVRCLWNISRRRRVRAAQATKLQINEELIALRCLHPYKAPAGLTAEVPPMQNTAEHRTPS